MSRALQVIWRDVAGFEGHYQVSNDGRVRSIKRGEPQVLRGAKGSHGYRTLTLSMPGRKPRTQLVHVLVAEAFIGPRPKGFVVRHLDGVPDNLRADNLAWGTYAENEADRKRHGTDNSGERNGMSKLTEEDVREIRSLLERGERGRSVARRFGVSPAIVSQIKSGDRWGWLK